MHAQGFGQSTEAQVVTFQRLTIQVDVQPFGHLDLDPRQARPHKHIVQPPTVAHQGEQRADHLLGRRQNADIQQAVIGQCVRAQHMPTARLASVADTQREQVALPVKVRPFQLAISGLQFAETRQAGEQVGRAAEHFFQVFGGVGGDLAAKTASGHVEEYLPAGLPKVDGRWRHIQQGECAGRIQRHPGGAREIIGGAQRHQHQAGIGLGLRHRLGDIAQGAIAATGNQVGIAVGQGLIDQALGVAALPRDPHRQLPALFAPSLHGSAHILVEGLLAVQNQQCLVGGHGVDLLGLKVLEGC
ncbi:hypothetical protein ALQ35_05692 [Pseudomonas fluorescens]|nr:hypothetical protein ALQ35_05692 [Pseudomonas fluorescens]